MANETFEVSLRHGPHHLLSGLAGEWRGMTRTFFDPGVLADESEWHGTIRPVLNGMFMLHEYTGSITGKALAGTALYGFNLKSTMFEVCWTDSFHNGTAMIFSRSSANPKVFSVIGSYPAPDTSPAWGWRTMIEQTGPDTLSIRMFNITPGGEESLAVETLYSRVIGSST